ncbi:hypothetical protein ACQ4LE_004503 [Meloidogyne hapla]
MEEKINKAVDEILKLQNWRNELVKEIAKAKLLERIKNDCTLDKKLDWKNPLDYIRKGGKFILDKIVEVGSIAATAACAPAGLLAPGCGFAVNKFGDLVFYGMEKLCEHLEKKNAGVS